MQLIQPILSYIVDFGLILFVLCALFCSYLPRREHFWPRLVTDFLLVVGLVNHRFSLFSVFQSESFLHLPFFYIGNLNLSYTVVFLIVTLALYACYKEKFFVVLYYSAGGYIAQHLLSSVSNIITSVARSRGEPYVSALSLAHFVLYLIGIPLLYFLCVYRNKKQGCYPVATAPRVVFSTASVVITALLSSWAYLMEYNNPAVFAYAFACCVLLLVLQFSITQRAQSDHEKQLMERIIAEKSHQMEDIEKTIDIINIKTHDLKKLIHQLQTIGDEESRGSFYHEIKESIDIYESIYRTGNEALDTVLTQKSLQCRQSNIRLTCMADGNLLSFMNIQDCYSLFANLIDNAIEAALKEGEEERDIGLYVREAGGRTVISVENYFSGEVTFENGMPVTSKADKENHGFGLRSIQYITEKYQGECLIRHEGNRFKINIVF